MASQNESIFLSECDLQNQKNIIELSLNYLKIQIIFEKTSLPTRDLNLKIYPRNNDAALLMFIGTKL